ncbi:sugar phosphate isomerase/epimerase family protein [Bowmanella dokdonensis]|uniref:Sugar phosphate isomerase/epimerase n=1 Tax=Bowmanella dokdonensis TaxID=751969 RepID=A0A939IPF8_9ALTE|nr:sugar phosphate isomerase/epimerase [Bowmanella dokdonensis]MBN7827398.1 sugar phosphate isomerase/epimerase [Bowmanella dokdonensis]
MKKLSFLLCALFLGTAQAKVEMPKLSVQLWSVSNEVKKDIDKALAELAGMGFDGVEFAGHFGPYGDNPAALKQRLTELGLVCSGAHIQFESLSEENRYQTLAFYQALDCPTLIVPWDERAFSADTVGQTIADLNRYLPLATAYGFSIGYHNHAQELATFEQDKTLWDEIAQNTPEEVVLQQDVGWSYVAGKDPAHYVRAYPGRTLTTHYKAKLRESDQGKTALIGQDGIDWQDLLSANIEVGGTHWLVVEQEEYPNGLTPMQAVKLSKQGLEEEIRKWKQTH